MGFDIPMNTTGAMAFPGSAPVQQPQMQSVQQPQMQSVQQPQMQSSGGGVRLKKGSKQDLSSANIIKICLAWDVANQDCDLDASAFLCDQNNHVLGDEWFVFYGKLYSPDGSVTHSGDSDGSASGFDEIVTVDTRRIDPRVMKIPFVITIDEALQRGLNFSMVHHAYVCAINGETNQEIARFDLTDYYANVTAMVVGELYRKNGVWKFNAVGDGVSKDLAGLCAMYGVNVAD